MAAPDPDLRPPPPAPGLAPDAAAWATRCLGAPPRAVHIVADSPRSLVARLETGTGIGYFKHDRILAPAEAVVLDRLRSRCPEHLAPVVGLEPERGWSLTRDVGPTGLDGAPTAAWCRVAEAFGRVQRDEGTTAEAWIQRGCRDRRGMRLHAALTGMLEHVEPLLPPDVARGLRSLRPRIEGACRALAEDPLPPTLVHQDLVPVNIVLADDRPVFLDWSDTVVGHPFFGLDRLLDSCWTDPERKAAVIAAYLSQFEDLATRDQLNASFRHVLWLRVLYEDLRWHDELAEVDPASAYAERMRRDMRLGLTQMVHAQA